MKNEPIAIGVYSLPGEWQDVEVVVVKNGDLYYPLTPCCGASATGSEGATCCRSCYEEVDSILGICWTEEEWRKGHDYEEVVR